MNQIVKRIAIEENIYDLMFEDPDLFGVKVEGAKYVLSSKGDEFCNTQADPVNHGYIMMDLCLFDKKLFFSESGDLKGFTDYFDNHPDRMNQHVEFDSYYNIIR